MIFKWVVGVLLLAVSITLQAETIEVTPDDNVTNLIENAQVDDVLLFEPGEYELNIILSKQVHLQGRSTKDVIFKADDISLPILTLDGAVNVDIQNITFLDYGNAIQINNSATGSNATIKNNVFSYQSDVDLVAQIVGVLVDSPQITISNNVFFGNDIAISNNQLNVTISENIFTQNEFDIDSTITTDIDTNCFTDAETVFENVLDNQVVLDVEFVDSENNDFHLKASSDCLFSIDSKLVVAGAYGGESADKVPASIVVNSVADENLAANGEVIVSWSQNLAREVEGYKVYYSTSPLKELNTLEQRDVSDGTVKYSTIKLEDIEDYNEEDEMSVLISGLQAATIKPQAPVLTSVQPRDKKLIINWEAVDSVDGYNLYYTGMEINPIDIPSSTTSYELTGLNNDTVYTVWLTAKSQLTHYFQVVAYESGNSSDEFRESFFTFNDHSLTPDDELESDNSNQLSQQPEALVAYPVLPNEGCFIATAAFNFYSSEEVMVLRWFRDEYLLTNSMGQEFVKQYYIYSPAIAQSIQESDGLKSVVRVMLYPLIILVKAMQHSWFMFIILSMLYLFLFYKLCNICFKTRITRA